MELILVAGFGNLGCKLLPLSWVYPGLKFLFIEGFWGTYNNARSEFTRANDVGRLVGPDYNTEDFGGNLQSFTDQLKDLHLQGKLVHRLEDIRNFKFKSLFEGEPKASAVFYHPIRPEKSYPESDTDAHRMTPTTSESRECREQYKHLIRELINHDRKEVLLYLERYAPFVHRVAIDKPLAVTPDQLAALSSFAGLHPDLDIRPIDHYIFKVDVERIGEAVRRNPGLVAPNKVERLEVNLLEKGLDEHRGYFADTGIVRDMMPHVGAMISYLFQNLETMRCIPGRVAPVMKRYPDSANLTVVQATLELNFWTGARHIPVTVRIGKGARRISDLSNPTRPVSAKEVVIHWKYGSKKVIDLTLKPTRPSSAVGETELGIGGVDWAGALEYLMEESPLADSMGSHFTFDRAMEITQSVLDCQMQVDCGAPSESEMYDEETFGMGPPIKCPKRIYFDGVIASMERAHWEAWNAIYALLGGRASCLPEPGEEESATHYRNSCEIGEIPDWYNLGTPTREIVDKLLDELAPDLRISRSSDELHQRFREIRRSVVLKHFDRAFSGDPGYEDERKYHADVLEYLDRIRSQRDRIILVSKGTALSVQQILDRLISFGKSKPAREKNWFRGFDEYRLDCDVEREYKDIIERNGGTQIIIFDDDVANLERVKGTPYFQSRQTNPQLLHLHTNLRAIHCDCSRGMHTFALCPTTFPPPARAAGA